jgi:hypothetical protein
MNYTYNLYYSEDRQKLMLTITHSRWDYFNAYLYNSKDEEFTKSFISKFKTCDNLNIIFTSVHMKTYKFDTDELKNTLIGGNYKLIYPISLKDKIELI